MQIQAKDAYQWRVTYQDGTTTDEYDELRSDGRGWAEREAKPVQAVTLTQDGVAAQSIPIPEGAEPVFFRRRFISLDPVTGEGGRKTVHCIGWTHGEEAVYLFVNDNGSTLLTADFQAV